MAREDGLDDGAIENGLVLKTADQMLEMMETEVLTQDALNKYPDLEGLCTRDMLIVLAVAHGFSYQAIAKATGSSKATVWRVHKRIDPTGKYRLSEESQKAFIKKRAQAKVSEALSTIQLDDMKDLNPLQSARVAKTLAEIASMQDKKNSSHFGEMKGIKSISIEFAGEGEEMATAEVIEMEDY